LTNSENRMTGSATWKISCVNREGMTEKDELYDQMSDTDGNSTTPDFVQFWPRCIPITDLNDIFCGADDD